MIVGALAVAGRTESAAGVFAGALIAEIDALLLGRSLSRFDEHSDLIGARALTVMMMSRFVLVSSMVGVVIIARGLDPLGVVTGFMLLPAAIVLVGMVSARLDRGETRHAG